MKEIYQQKNKTKNNSYGIYFGLVNILVSRTIDHIIVFVFLSLVHAAS